jgi:hypothetical protein
MLKNYSALLIILVLAYTATAQVNLQLGLIVNYPMDNSTLDATSNHYDLTATGSPVGAVNRLGMSNHAYSLNASNPDYFTADGVLLSPSEVTISAWVNLTDASTDQKIVGKAVVGGGYLLGVNASQIDPEFWDSYNNHFRHPSGFIATNAWDHLVVSFKANDYMKSYINGTLIDSVATFGFGLGTTFWPLTIGGAPWQPTALNADGSIDDVYVYDRAINADEVYALYTLITNTIDQQSSFGAATIYPQPSHSGNVTVDFKNNVTGLVMIKITDALGKEVFSKTFDHPKKEFLDLSALSKGLYSVSFINGNRMESHRLVMQ